jgi:hypothetical protein
MTTPSSTQPSMWQRTTTRRLLKWLFSWRTARRAVIGFAALATLVGLFYAEENFRGKRAWDRYRHELEAGGEQLDWKALIPKPVPDDQNFAAMPLIKSWFVRSNSFNSNYWQQDNYGQASGFISSSPDKKDGGHRHFTDLVAWTMAFDAIRSGKFGPSRWLESNQLDRESRAKAAPTVLEGLKTNEAVFAELRAASQRPYSRYPIDYDVPNPAEILLPHLNGGRAVCQRLSLKACAELAAGRSEDALEDLKLALYMADSLKEEPFIISYLVRIAYHQLAIQPVWEGLAEHAWSDAKLQELQARLQQYDFVADLKQPLDAERAAGLATIDFVRRKGLGQLIGALDTEPWAIDKILAKRFGGFMPRGWYYQEQLSFCRLSQLLLGAGLDATNRRVSPSRLASNTRAFDREFLGGRVALVVHHRLMSALLVPALGNFVGNGARAQTAADQAALACALERYRLANGQFPERLDALVPQFTSQLPHDVITGEPYKYRRTDGGQFVLYSVGWNEKDDGGVPGKTLWRDDKDGDWVWQYPARQ